MNPTRGKKCLARQAFTAPLTNALALYSDTIKIPTCQKLRKAFHFYFSNKL
jgi:hypothetical protein